MTAANQIEQLLDLCFYAKKITETLPPLPKGMKHRHNFVLYEVYKVLQRQGVCHVSDISRSLKTSMPSITKLIGELEKMELLSKTADPQDKRAVQLTLTEKGSQFVQDYMLDFHKAWAENLSDVTEEEIQSAQSLLEKFKTSMPKDHPSRGNSDSKALIQSAGRK